MRYELYYWSGIQGRGEFVRLALEEAGEAYDDVGRGEDGDARVAALLDDRAIATPPFAPPILRAGSLWIAQTANILQFLGERHGLAPKALAGRLWTQQLQLTIADLVAEAHDTHHPIASGLYYEQQKAEAKKRASDFVAHRMPKFLGHFERALATNPRGAQFLVGARLTYADLSLYQVVEGLRYAFPNAMKKLERTIPRVVALRDRVARRPRIAAYVGSTRRIPFNEQGIFRHYAELDR